MSLGHILVILTIFQTLHWQQDCNSLKAQVMVNVFFLRNKVFVSEDMYVVFLDVMLLHT